MAVGINDNAVLKIQTALKEYRKALNNYNNIANIANSTIGAAIKGTNIEAAFKQAATGVREQIDRILGYIEGDLSDIIKDINNKYKKQDSDATSMKNVASKFKS